MLVTATCWRRSSRIQLRSATCVFVHTVSPVEFSATTSILSRRCLAYNLKGLCCRVREISARTMGRCSSKILTTPHRPAHPCLAGTCIPVGIHVEQVCLYRGGVWAKTLTVEPRHQAWQFGRHPWLNMAASRNRPNPVAPFPSQVFIAFKDTLPSWARGVTPRTADAHKRAKKWKGRRENW